MNSDRMEGSWEQVKGNVQKMWGKLTNDDLDVIEGNRKLLAGKIQERYGIAQDEAQKQVDEWNKH
ncbi:MAG: CsbD family protein [Asticcacaulis sp.]